MNWYQATRTTAIGWRRRPLIVTLMLATLWSATNVLGQQMRFFPIRSAPLGSPEGTIGEPVTPEFNNTLGCWELALPGGGVEVDLAVHAFGWSHAPGNPNLGAILATVDPAGYSNGVGGDLAPKGWPDYRYWGIYLPNRACSGNGDPCSSPPFDNTCDDGANGTCEHNPDWVMPPCAHDVAAHAAPNLHFAWGDAAQVDCVENFGEIKTLGGLILDVPNDASGTYIIAFNPDPNNTLMLSGQGINIPIVELTPACLTIIRGACCMDAGQQHSCQDDTTESDCAAAAGLFAGDGSTCSGQVGACCLDNDLDGFDDTCTVMDRNCCFSQGGSFLGAGSSCIGQVGACCLDSNNDDFYDTCRVINQTCCDAQGGSFGAAGSQCSASSGACCLDEGTCVEANLACCESQEGSAQGPGSRCLGDLNDNGDDDACESGFPAVSQWGLMVLVLLLLVGIKISFDRRQPA